MAELAVLATGDGASASPSSSEIWRRGVEVLCALLQRPDGAVSSMALRKELEQRGMPDAKDLVSQLKFYNFDEAPEQLATPAFRWRTHGRSFYTEDAYLRLEQQNAKEAADEAARAEIEAKAKAEVEERARVEAARIEAEISTETEPSSQQRAKPRQDEKLLGKYVVSALEELYESDESPTDAPYVFDVHQERAGSQYENVDVLAVHWRTERLAELVTVEVKLAFTAELVQQARNYTRFSDRVWIAVPLPIPADAANVAQALREHDARLFEHVIHSGLGILACRRRQGRAYEIIPVHWPCRQQPDLAEKEAFKERYRDCLERARVLRPKGYSNYPAE